MLKSRRKSAVASAVRKIWWIETVSVPQSSKWISRETEPPTATLPKSTFAGVILKQGPVELAWTWMSTTGAVESLEWILMVAPICCSSETLVRLSVKVMLAPGLALMVGGGLHRASFE